MQPQKPKSKTEMAKDAIAAKKATQPVPKATPGLVTFQCGHTRHTNELKVIACSTCMNAQRVAKAQAFGARRAFKGRLPTGSSFGTRWDGKTWYGTLVVPDVGIFEAEGPDLFPLQAKLDEMYRKAVEVKP